MHTKNGIKMEFVPIEIDRKALTIMGVCFPDLESLNTAANAIGSNMYEGFVPTPALVELYRDYSQGKIKMGDLPRLISELI